jgi:hypothetical protein
MPILQLKGTAEKDGDVRPFEASITIGSNRTVANTDGTQAGAFPICKERIVPSIRTRVILDPPGSLLLRIDPRKFFVNVDFSSLPASHDGFAFANVAMPADQASRNLYQRLHKPTPYGFEWVP